MPELIEVSAPTFVVGPAGNWGPAVEGLTLGVLDDDGGEGVVFGRIFEPGQAEIDIFVKASALGDKTLVVPLTFSTLDQAHRAGKVLHDAFATVNAIRAEPVPEHDCETNKTMQRFSRALPMRWVCTVCCTDLREGTHEEEDAWRAAGRP